MRGTVSWGSARCTLARLATTAGKLDQGPRPSRAGARARTALGRAPWLIRTRGRDAELLVSAGGEDDAYAADLAREAMAQAEALGVSPTALPGAVARLAVLGEPRS
jgi:hypothetical protein